jgi:catechol 2,3-dioxygenase-like lactoylglutathione lyase family enzyme
MLSASRLQTIVCTTNLPAAERFYGDVLGLTLKSRSDGAAVFDVGGADLRVSPVAQLEPSGHTVVGFQVADLKSVMAGLSVKGVAWERIPGMPHDSSGALRTPGGSTVVWLRDPDGNLLSIVQFM